VTAKPAEPLSGARLLLELLKLNGVDVIFGYPGGAVIGPKHLAEQLVARRVFE